MPSTRTLSFAISMVMVVTILSSTSSAQVYRPLRWLGHGFSDGYLKCNPGPNTDYYNPYSAHNSQLISQNHGAHAIPNRQRYSSPDGIPFSVYATPAPVATGNSSFRGVQRDATDNSFVPYDPVNPEVGVKINSADNTWKADPSSPDGAIDNTNDSSFIPRLKGSVQAIPEKVEYSNAGFRSREIGTIVDENIENPTKLFDPFIDNN